MNDDEHFALARLEEKVLDVAKEQVYTTEHQYAYLHP
jgi:hypothetical protein